MRSKLDITIIATSPGFLLVQLDVSIINVALANIGADTQTGVTGLQWVVGSCALAFASLLLSAGALGDRIGARRAFIGGLVLFVAASLGCALAPDAATLIAARTLQGAGASALVPCSLALLNHACHDNAAARSRAISLWTAAGSIGLAIGPVLGGVLVTVLGWRSIFLIKAAEPFSQHGGARAGLADCVERKPPHKRNEPSEARVHDSSNQKAIGVAQSPSAWSGKRLRNGCDGAPSAVTGRRASRSGQRLRLPR